MPTVEDKLSIDRVVYNMSTRPAELMRLDAGVLEVGKPAGYYSILYN